MSTELMKPLPAWEKLPAPPRPQAPNTLPYSMADFAALVFIVSIFTVFPIAGIIASSAIIGALALAGVTVGGAGFGLIDGLRDHRHYRQALQAADPSRTLSLFQLVDKDDVRLIVGARDRNGVRYLSRSFAVDEDQEAHAYAVEVQEQIASAYEAAQERADEKIQSIAELEATAASIAQTVSVN